MQLNLEEQMLISNVDSFEGNVGFAIGTGRCGTKFMADIIGMEPHVASAHERNILNESFHRYCKWYGLPVDDEGFLHTKEVEVRQDLQEHLFSFEASAQLSFSVRDLYDRFRAKFILLVRSPERVVNSFMRKTMYDKAFIRADPEQALGYQPCDAFHHFLGRIAPLGEKFVQWNNMGRVGKLAWYWNAVNAQILKQFKAIPSGNWRVEKIEDLSFSRYVEMAEFLDFQVTVTEQTYDELVRSRPNALMDVPTVGTWSSSDASEFEDEAGPMAEKLGYEYRVRRILGEGPESAHEHVSSAEPGRPSEKRPKEASSLNRPLTGSAPSSLSWWQKFLLKFQG